MKIFLKSFPVFNLILVVFLVMPSLSYSIDGKRLDFRGVKLGMTIDEVKSKFKPFKDSSTEIRVLEQKKRGEVYAYQISYEDSNERFVFLFSPNQGKKLVQVWLFKSHSNRDEIVNSLLRKYGTPDAFWAGSWQEKVFGEKGPYLISKLAHRYLWGRKTPFKGFKAKKNQHLLYFFDWNPQECLNDCEIVMAFFSKETNESEGFSYTLIDVKGYNEIIKIREELGKTKF